MVLFHLLDFLWMGIARDNILFHQKQAYCSLFFILFSFWKLLWPSQVISQKVSHGSLQSQELRSEGWRSNSPEVEVKFDCIMDDAFHLK
ncbi:hypothetical protein SUGI_0290370 [Cryptomeria japonica]|nr:hypothetical protein SUGI_0290370 [Cryptomeria japonica]